MLFEVPTAKVSSFLGSAEITRIADGVAVREAKPSSCTQDAAATTRSQSTMDASVVVSAIYSYSFPHRHFVPCLTVLAERARLFERVRLDECGGLE